ncbi:MAG: CARDB domain-containing protein [Nitrososphaerota archaeon]
MKLQLHVNYLVIVLGVFVISSVIVPVSYAEDNDSDLVWLPETIKITGMPESTIYKAGENLSISANAQNIDQDNFMAVQFRLQVIDERENIVYESSNESLLETGNVSTMRYDWVPEIRGVYRLVFDADFTNQVIEKNEDNNRYEMTIKVIDSASVLTKSISADGTINVYVESDPPKVGEEMYMYLTFTDTNEKKIEHINYAITGKQDGELVFFADNAYEAEGEGLHITKALDSDSPVDIQVTILGIGLQGEQNNWSGPKDEVVSLQVIPEFPTALIVLIATTSMAVVFTTKTHRIQSAR